MEHNARTEQEVEETESLNEHENTTDNRISGHNERKYNFGIGLFGVINVVLISFLGTSAKYVFYETKVLVVPNGDVDICVPCVDLRLHPDDKQEGIERRGKDRTICCVVKEEGPDALVGYYIDHWLKKKLATDTDRQFVRYKCVDKEIIETQKPIIKLIGKHEKQPAEHHKLHWDGDHETAIVPGDGSITHHKEHGFIEIKKSGLYHVYNQVFLDHDTKAHISNIPDIYIHKIILIEAEVSHHKSPFEITLMKTSNTHCESKSNKQTITSYLGGAFQLSEGDKLAACVNNKTEIIPVPHMNFFGAHML